MRLGWSAAAVDVHLSRKKRSDRIGRCDPGEALQSIDGGAPSSLSITTPQAARGAECPWRWAPNLLARGMEVRRAETSWAQRATARSRNAGRANAASYLLPRDVIYIFIVSLLSQSDSRGVQNLPFCYLCGREFVADDSQNRDHVPPECILARPDHGARTRRSIPLRKIEVRALAIFFQKICSAVCVLHPSAIAMGLRLTTAGSVRMILAPSSDPMSSSER
jgi:hypothetical protein